MTVPVTLPPSPAPSRADPANFATRADAYHAWLVPAVAEMNAQNAENNALNANVNDKATQAAASAATATDKAAQAAASAANVLGQSAIAQEAAISATGSVSLAGAHASAASAATATASAQAASAASAASAANTALLALGNAIANGVGAFGTDADGNLIGSYNEPTVTSMSINASGELLVAYP